VKQGEKGFTLIEVVIGVAIMALVVGAIATTTTTILMNYGQAAEQNVVLPQVQNAGYWISRDVQMASGITPSGPNGFPLYLDIPVDTDEDNDYVIEYLFEEGNNLIRDDSSQPIESSKTLIAVHIDTDNTIFSTVDAAAGHYRFTVTAAKDGAGVTMSYEIKQRISLGY
jgi:prepilin-type N-terminal cleavage/methylation domain-containing protein